MRKFFETLKHKIVLMSMLLVSLLGAITTRLTTCTGQAGLVANQIAVNPNNQIVAMETASFVANLFYEGADDPFPTQGAGGETGKLTHVVLKKGEKLFGEALSKIITKTDDIIQTSRKWSSPQIQEGARAIQKKIGHAESVNAKSAFKNIKYSQENAEQLIYDIINNADAVIIRSKRTMIYNSNGQGLSVNTKTGKFIGFVERNLEKELVKQ